MVEDYLVDKWNRQGVESGRTLGLPGYSTTSDPGGKYYNPEGHLFKENYSPQRFVNQLINSKEAQDYADVGGLASASGVNAIRGGEQDAVSEARNRAAAGGLGKGFADQAESGIRQNATISTSDMLLKAAMEERARRFQFESYMATASMEANKSRFAQYLQKKAAKAGSDAAFLGLLGDIGGAVLGAAGTMIGGPAGGAAGAAAGGALSSAFGGASGAASGVANAVGGMFGGMNGGL